MKPNNLKEYRVRRHRRLRQKIAGTAARPRMAVYVSNTNLYVQFVDDDAQRTLASASSLGMKAKLNVETAAKVGELAAEAAKKAGISLIVVDRGGFKFHGRVKAAVEAALANGLKVNDKESK
jgi:large subunit ribosomal protein L18